MLKIFEVLVIVEACAIVGLLVYNYVQGLKFKKVVTLLQQRQVQIFKAGLKRVELETRNKIDRMSLDEKVDYINSLLVR
jgi:hypothetical protein